MATNEAEIRVNVEAAIHSGLRELIQAIEAAHGIRVNAVGVEWLDASNVRDQKFLITDLTISTTSGPTGT